MKFTDRHEFDAPASKVIKMFSDPDYFSNKYQALGFKNIKVLEQSTDGSDFSITVRYEAPSDAPIPGFAKKFMGATNVVTQTDSWNIDSMTGHLQAEIQGLPAKVSADMELVDDGDGSANELSWNINCSVPLIGGKIDKLVAQDIQAKSEADLNETRAQLENY